MAHHTPHTHFQTKQAFEKGILEINPTWGGLEARIKSELLATSMGAKTTEQARRLQSVEAKSAGDTEGERDEVAEEERTEMLTAAEKVAKEQTSKARMIYNKLLRDTAPHGDTKNGQKLYYLKENGDLQKTTLLNMRLQNVDEFAPPQGFVF